MSILDIFGSPYGKKLVKKEIKALLVLSQKQPLTVDKLCREIDDKHYIIAVSYTHLTLPTTERV